MNNNIHTFNGIEETEFGICEEISFDHLTDLELEARISKEGKGGIQPQC